MSTSLTYTSVRNVIEFSPFHIRNVQITFRFIPHFTICKPECRPYKLNKKENMKQTFQVSSLFMMNNDDDFLNEMML